MTALGRSIPQNARATFDLDIFAVSIDAIG